MKCYNQAKGKPPTSPNFDDESIEYKDVSDTTFVRSTCQHTHDLKLLEIMYEVYIYPKAVLG